MSRRTSRLLFLLILQSAARSQEFFNTTPQPIKSNFTCVGRITGYYADVPSNCRVYHNCDDQGNKFSYYCPEMTAFRQEALICDHAHLVDCQAGTRIGKKSQEATKVLDQSTTQSPDRWTTSNPFRDFFLNQNSSIRDTGKTNSFGFHFGNNSSESASGFKNNYQNMKDVGQFMRLSENLRNEHRQTFFEPNATRFFGNTLDRQITTKKISAEVKTREDQLVVNSRSHPAWYNNGENFRSHPEVSVERKLDDGHLEQRAESTTSYFTFGQMQTTKSYFNFKNSNYPRSDKPDTRSTQIPSSTSPKTFRTTSSTSDIPLQDFTASLKPLVPNTLEYDPYYPRESWTTTESYYTPSERNKLPRALEAPNFEPSIFGVYFKIPDVWPDLNTIDDIVDRRRLFYIPRVEKLQ